MRGQRSSLVGLALLALLVLVAFVTAAGARPSADPAGTTRDAFLATCPHVLNTLATPEEISGSWHIYEILHEAREGLGLPSPKANCVRFDVGGEGTQLSVVAYKLVNGSVQHNFNFTCSLSPNGMWHTPGVDSDDGVFIGLSSDGHLLLICTKIFNTKWSMSLGRTPTVASAELEAARRPLAPGTQRDVFRFDHIGHCGSPSQ